MYEGLSPKYLDEEGLRYFYENLRFNLKKLGGFNYGYVGMARNRNENVFGEASTTAITWTDDFGYMNVVTPYVNNLTTGKHYLSDSCKLAHVGAWWYATFGGQYYKSDDLVDWVLGENHIQNPFDDSYAIWAGQLAEDKDGNHLFICAIQYSDEPAYSTYNTTKYFVIGYSYVTFDVDTGEMIFDDVRYLNVCNKTDQSESYIDPSLVYNPVTDTYILAVKNELTTKIELYSGNSINALSQCQSLLDMELLEAPNLVNSGANTIITCERYVERGDHSNGYLGYTLANKHTPFYGIVSDGLSVRLPYLNKTYTPFSSRHPTWTECDMETISTLVEAYGPLRKSLGSEAGMSYKERVSNICMKADASDLVRTIVNEPGITYQLTSESPSSITLECKKAFHSWEPVFIVNDRPNSAANSHVITLGDSFVLSGRSYTLRSGDALMLLPIYAQNWIAVHLSSAAS